MELERRLLPMEELSQLIQLQLEKGGRAKLTVTGSSMYPMLRNCRDVVELIPVFGQQKKGDIILYRRDNGRYILHRIISLTGDGYICCGDNQWEKEPVRQDQLLAVVSGFTRKGKAYTLEHPGYRLYNGVWLALFPVRRYLLAIRRRLGRLTRNIKGGRSMINKIKKYWLYIVGGLVSVLLICVLLVGIINGVWPWTEGGYFGNYLGKKPTQETTQTTEGVDPTEDDDPEETDKPGGILDIEDSDIKIPLDPQGGVSDTDSNEATEEIQEEIERNENGEVEIPFDDLLDRAGQ